MAQLERPQRQIDASSKTPATIHTMEQLLRVSTAGEASKSKQSPTLSSCSSTSSTHSSSPSSPFFQRLRHHDSEEDHGQSQKKSVLTKVKEKAKKLRHSLSKKKHEDWNVTSPSSATGLEADGAEDEAEYQGPPVYESEKTPVKGNARQHPSPRANPVTPERHFISTSDKHMVEQHLEKTLTRSISKKKTTPQPATITITPTTQPETSTTPVTSTATTTQPAKTTINPNATTTDIITVTKTNTNNNTDTNANADTLSGPTITTTETVARKLTPVHIEAPDEAQSITTKVQNLAVSNYKPTEHHHDHTASSSSAAAVTPKATNNASLSYAAPRTAPAKALSRGSSTSPRSFAPSPPVTPIAPVPVKVPSQVSSSSPRTFASSPSVTPTAPASVTTPPSGKNTSPTSQIWDKGVSVKEYLMTKLEPGEDEKALSQVISEAMSPRRTPGDAGVMEKVREAVTSLLRTEGSPKYTDTSNLNTPTSATTTPRMSSQFPASTTPNTSPRSSSQMPASTNASRAASQMAASSTNASHAASQMPASSTNATRASSQRPASSSNVYRTSSQIPVSTNAQPADYEVAQEENHGRILQAN